MLLPVVQNPEFDEAVDHKGSIVLKYYKTDNGQNWSRNSDARAGVSTLEYPDTPSCQWFRPGGFAAGLAGGPARLDPGGQRPMAAARPPDLR